jgi:hypothetical protein
VEQLLVVKSIAQHEYNGVQSLHNRDSQKSSDVHGTLNSNRRKGFAGVSSTWRTALMRHLGREETESSHLT